MCRQESWATNSPSVSHTRPGDEVIIESTSHIIRYEGGSASSLSGVQLCCIPGVRGILEPDQIVEAIRPSDVHYPKTSLLCLEQTHNSGGGSVYPLTTIHQLVESARKYDLALHLDGARLFNAVTATGVSAADYARPFDSVSFCLSKGLGAPIGSLIVSDTDRVAQLRRLRKLYGGGMRQVGIIAAAGIYALEHNIGRLKDDHAHAKRLAELLQNISAVSVEPNLVETNIIIFRVSGNSKSTIELIEECKNSGVLLNAVGDRAFRVVTHLDISAQDIEAAGQVFAKVFSG